MNEDFARWFRDADSGSLLSQWDKLKDGIIKFVKNPKKQNIIQLIDSLSDDMNEEGMLESFFFRTQNSI